MKAVVIEEFGDLDKIHVAEMPTPTPKDTEVQIEVRYVGVNPVEWKLGAGVLKDVIPHEFPIILGWDVAGVISEVGSKVNTLSVGDEVWGYCRNPVVHLGTYAEYFCFDAEHVVPKPKRLSLEHAAAIPLVGLTAWQALFDVADLKAGQSALIHAGAGGVGSLAIQLAKNAGASVYTTASPENHQYVKSLGADQAIDYKEQDFTDAVKQWEPGGVDFCFDCVGGDVLEKSYTCVKKDGCLVSIVAPTDPDKAKANNIYASHVFVRPNGPQLAKLGKLFDDGKIREPNICVMGIDEVVSALQKVKTEHTKGKIVLAVKGNTPHSWS